MSENSKFLMKSAKLFDLPPDAITGTAHIEINGTKQIIIEHHKGILEYSPTFLSVNLGGSVLTVSGCDLLIVAMNDQGLRLEGNIFGIQFEAV